ncbi:MAG: hypothetical protein A2V86_01425 [Deltaproteobacteria bacterium RBG_16_49_23]|nr:MAG: hypothetical protein A2V86_01425 [Deltaproteobacteria bacterium RBG_16_49_23]
MRFITPPSSQSNAPLRAVGSYEPEAVHLPPLTLRGGRGSYKGRDSFLYSPLSLRGDKGGLSFNLSRDRGEGEWFQVDTPSQWIKQCLRRGDSDV